MLFHEMKQRDIVFMVIWCFYWVSDTKRDGSKVIVIAYCLDVHYPRLECRHLVPKYKAWCHIVVCSMQKNKALTKMAVLLYIYIYILRLNIISTFEYILSYTKFTHFIMHFIFRSCECFMHILIWQCLYMFCNANF